MAALVVPAFFSDPVAFSTFVEEQLSCGRAIVPAEISADLFDDVVLRIEAVGKDYELPATVAHPGLPGPGGATCVGLAVSLRPADHQALAELLAHLESGDHVSDIEIELSLDLDLELDVEGEAAPQTERPILTLDVPEAPEAEEPLPLSDLDYFLGDSYEISQPAPDTSIQAEVLEQLVETAQAPGQNITSPGMKHTELERIQRGSVDAMIDDALSTPTEAGEEPLNAREASDAARYRALYPDKALRADDYYQAAVADVRNGSDELARTNANLAVAYNPTVPAYRELLDQVEQRLGVRVR